MFVMHFCLVCTMNRIVRIFAVYILIVATTGAAEPNTKTSTSTGKWKESTTTTTRWKEPTTRWNQPTTTIRWKEPTPTKEWKTPTTTKWQQQTTTPGWKYPITTTIRPTTKATPKVTNHGVVAVASFSGLDSRNGRLSSMNGIKIFPPVDSSMIKTDEKGNFIFNSVNGKMPMPITITKQGDGVSGTIRILPGSVSVSSSASSSPKSGPAAAIASSYNPWPGSFMKPMMNDIFFPPFPTFPTIPDPIINSRFPDTSFHRKIQDPFSYMRMPEPIFHHQIHDPWFSKNMFKHAQPKHDMFQTWFYPSFSPFINYW